MNTTTKQIMVAAALTMLTACGNNENPASNNPSPDMNSSDMSGDMLNDMGEKDTSCTPNKTTCEATDCGMIDNGCGTTLDCGACACTNGVAKARSCGVCDLGKPVCDADANSKEIASCKYPAELISNFTEDLCQSMVFVSADAAPNGTGAVDAPFDTYAKALEFLDKKAGIIVVARGTYNEPLIVKERIHVLGGYRFTNGLVQNDTQIPEFKPPAKTGEPVFGMIAKEIFEPTLVYRVRVTAPDADTEQTSYGAYIVDTQFLTISHSQIYAGRGGDGVDGADGTKGNDGEDGEDSKCAFSISQGGENPMCRAAGGGDGGILGTLRTTGHNTPPSDGENALQANGGKAGVNERTSGEHAGKDGEDGPKFMSPAPDGNNGSLDDSIDKDLWKSGLSATNGVDGQRGSGGGGGGGSGAPRIQNRNLTGGTNGAGGGSGGCGGTGGMFGTNGSASIGALLVRSTVQVLSSGIYGGRGGNGGKGGVGGFGGQKGVGGKAKILSQCQNATITEDWTSGNGGDGANGQTGGNGGSGVGGPSYGMYCHSSDIKAQMTQIKSTSGGNGGIDILRGKTVDELRCR